RVRPGQRLHVVRAGLHALELALVLAYLALDLRDAEIDGAVHVLGRLVTGDLEAVVQLEGDVDAVVVTFRREYDVTGNRIRQVLSDSLHALSRVGLQSFGRIHVTERHRELH